MKRLYRSEKDKKLAGLCGGAGDYLDVDPVIVRLVFVGLALITGLIPLTIAYFVAWFIVPPEPTLTFGAGASDPGRATEAPR